MKKITICVFINLLIISCTGGNSDSYYENNTDNSSELDEYSYEQLYDSVLVLFYGDHAESLVLSNKEEGEHILQYLIKENYVPSYSLLGCELITGDKLDKSIKNGLEYLEYAISKNDKEAIICKSIFLFNQNDIKECVELLERGCNLKDNQACIELASFYLFGAIISSEREMEESIFLKNYYNPNGGIIHLISASSRGMSEAKFMLGDIYLTGLDSIVERDLIKGKKLLKECLADSDYSETYYIEDRLNEVFGEGNW
jgi:TPR repeat protein